MLKFTKKELAMFRRLNTPAKIQDFLNTIPHNFESDGIDVVKSPIRVLRENNAQCIEGALLGAYIMSLHGFPPLLMNLESTHKDWDHVVVPFKIEGRWGALSKTNHVVLRYREPIYLSLRELAISYFHEYYLEDGTKTLRRYSRPLNLNVFESDWMVQEDDLWGIDEELDVISYQDIASPHILKRLRKADPIEVKAMNLTDWKE